MQLLLVLVAALSLTGCFASGALYRHPGTNEARVCADHGIGDIGTAVAALRYSSCKDHLEEAGFVRARSLTLQEVHCLGWKPNENGTCSNEQLTK